MKSSGHTANLPVRTDSLFFAYAAQGVVDHVRHQRQLLRDTLRQRHLLARRITEGTCAPIGYGH